MSGPQLKPSYFKNTNTKLKVKAIPLNEKATGKLHSKSIRKGQVTRGMVKSTSFKTEEGVCNCFELANEKQSVNLTQIKNSSVDRNKELIVLEGENSSALDFYNVLDRGLIDGDNSSEKFPYWWHPIHLSFLFFLFISIIGGFRLQRDAPSHASRSSISASSDGLNLQFQKLGQIPNECSHHYVNAASNSRHPTYLCSVDKHCASAKLSADRVPLENANRSNRWRAARETIMSNQEALKCTNRTNQYKEPPIPGFGHSAEVANKELSLHCFRRTNSQEGRSNTEKSFVFDKSELTLNRHVANQTAGRLDPFGNNSKECEKSSEQVLSNILRTSVIPELEFFWQGSFEVLRAGRLPEHCDGLQAHFSSYASGEVLEVAKKFPPYKVQLQEVPCISSWSQHFHGNRAKEHNIVLFFFAKDIESYRSNYCKLLEKMLKFDLALKGNFGSFELLIFPSNKLSENSQRWNRLFFLWGIFKERRSSSLEVLPNAKQDPCKSTIDVKLPITFPEASKYQGTNTFQNSDVAGKYVAHIEVTPALSTGSEKKTHEILKKR